MRELDQKQFMRGREVVRREDISRRNQQEIVNHPGNNHIWMHLAHFIDEKEQIDLEGV